MQYYIYLRLVQRKVLMWHDGMLPCHIIKIIKGMFMLWSELFPFLLNFFDGNSEKFHCPKEFGQPPFDEIGVTQFFDMLVCTLRNEISHATLVIYDVLAGQLFIALDASVGIDAQQGSIFAY